MKILDFILFTLFIFSLFACSEDAKDPEPQPETPTASFSYNPQAPQRGDTILFTNESRYADAFLWNVVGQVSEDENLTYVTEESGTLEARLIAFGEGGSDTLIRTIEVLPPPTRLTFRVQDREGDPVSGAEVSLYKTYEDWKTEQNPVTPTVISDKDGNVFFEALPSGGTYFVDAQKEYASNWGHLIEISVKANQENTHFPILVYENPISLLASAEGTTWVVETIFLNDVEVDFSIPTFGCRLDDELTYYKSFKEGEALFNFSDKICFDEESGLHKWKLTDDNCLRILFPPHSYYYCNYLIHENGHLEFSQSLFDGDYVYRTFYKRK